jgi:hypothetical protein
MYTEGASLASARLTTEQANALRAKAQSVQERVQRMPTPVPSGDDEDEMTEARSLEASTAMRFKSLRDGGAGQEEEDQDGLASGLTELERPPTIEG